VVPQDFYASPTALARRPFFYGCESTKIPQLKAGPLVILACFSGESRESEYLDTRFRAKGVDVGAGMTYFPPSPRHVPIVQGVVVVRAMVSPFNCGIQDQSMEYVYERSRKIVLS